MQDAGGYATRERLDAASYWAVRRLQEDAGGYATREAAYSPTILLAFFLKLWT